MGSHEQAVPWAGPSPVTQQIRPSRRALLAAPLLLAGPAGAQPVDASLTSIMRRGALRVSIGFWAADFLPQEGASEPRMHDSFHHGMAQWLGTRLGVRAEIEPAPGSGQGVQRLLAGQVDLALAPPISREMLRRVMFCTPHVAMDLVVVARGLPGPYRRRSALLGLRLASLTTLAAALTERSAPGTLPAIQAVTAPWPLLRALLDGRVDGIIVTSVMARTIIRRFPEAGLSIQNVLLSSVFAGAVAYGAHDLLRALNAITDELLQDGSLDALFRQEAGYPLPRPDAS
jgi:ABC-type amino acid transport substrate-binding protein